METSPVHLYKFGGTSVATAARMRAVVALVARETSAGRHIVVTSAMGGVTDRLIEAIDGALARADTHTGIVSDIRERHRAVANEVAAGVEKAALVASIDALIHALGELLDGVYLLRECTPRTRDAILGMGERLAAPILAAAFRSDGVDAASHEATGFIQTDDTFGEAKVNFAETKALARTYFDALPPGQIAVVTGFIAATGRGVRTTLGRSGSDYTATILAGALSARRVIIWTDVDGVLSADPRLVPEAFTLPSLSYREAAEMAYFGAKVLHPRTMRPLIEPEIALQIKNTLDPDSPGTIISAASTQTEGRVKAVSAIRNLCVVMLEGTGMAGVPGISARTFAALGAKHINVLLIAQASSEQSICLAVRSGDSDEARAALESAFDRELERKEISRIYSLPDCAIVSVVGDYMRMQPGLAGRMFSTLGRGNINVLAIAQGASETNISAVIQDGDVRHAVRALHATFAMAHGRVHLCLIGPGGVGKALLEILERQAPELFEDYRMELRLVAAANSRHMVWDEDGIAFDAVADRLALEGEPLSLDGLIERLIQSHLERLVVVDATASSDVAGKYATLLGHGIAVVTPNKRANAGTQPAFDELQLLSRRRRVPYHYETTVGAALPVLGTLRDLCRTGDRIERIEGVLSGTLAFVMNGMADGKSFSESVLAARTLGFTEPDPRDDLGGEDVARKMMVLAREAGFRLERADLEIESLIPPHLREVSVETFMERLHEADEAWETRRQKGSLQYLASISEGRFEARVREVSSESPFARLSGTDNMVIFTTARYHERPLVIQGRGAGPEVTASGVFADVVRAAREMA